MSAYPDPKADGLPEPQAFGDSLTADHKVLNDDNKSRDEDRQALVILDRYTKWLQSYPVKDKTHKEVIASFNRFLPPQMRPHHVYTDNSGELKKAFEEKGWAADTSVPHRSETNGQAESAVRKVKEGTSSALVQSGFLESWWGEAMACYCFLRNVYDKLENHKAPYEIRFGEPFSGPIIHFGAQISYKPIR